MYSRGELFMRSREGYFDVYSSSQEHIHYFVSYKTYRIDE